MFTRDGIVIPCPDNAAGLYIRTRTDQIVKVYILDHDIQQCIYTIMIIDNPKDLFQRVLHWVVKRKIFLIRNKLHCKEFVL